MATMFKRGFKAVKEESVRQEENRKRMNGNLWKFFLAKDGDEAEITFLTEQPINYYEHNIKTHQNGKEKYESIPCIGEGCKHCANGDRPTFKSAWLVVDHRENKYTDKDGKEQVTSDNVRLFIYGTKIASQLDRIASKYGILNRTITMIRMGKGTSTTYMFERGDEVDLTEDDIRELLPETLQETYDGTIDSLYTILENQIMAMAGANTDSDADEDETPKKNSNLVSLDDDEDDEIEKVLPKSKSKFGNKKFGSKKSPSKIENSVKTKTSVKKLLKKRD